MVKTLDDGPAKAIARTHSKKKNDALYVMVAEVYCLVTYLPLCRTRDLVHTLRCGGKAQVNTLANKVADLEAKTIPTHRSSHRYNDTWLQTKCKRAQNDYWYSRKQRFRRHT